MLSPGGSIAFLTSLISLLVYPTSTDGILLSLPHNVLRFNNKRTMPLQASRTELHFSSRDESHIIKSSSLDRFDLSYCKEFKETTRKVGVEYCQEPDTTPIHLQYVKKNAHNRRNFCSSLFGSLAIGISTPSNAYEKAYPDILEFKDGDSSSNLESIREERIKAKRYQAKQSREKLVESPLMLSGKDFIGSIACGGALWLILGSRSNPIVNPLANALYNENSMKGSWVKDRNEGLFAPFPIAFSILMFFIFFVLGIAIDRILLFISEEDPNLVLQLAGVSLIGGGSLELGRIAAGEKMKTRIDFERDHELEMEFQEFAQKNLLYGEGGSVHKSEVISAFRRSFAKYRVQNDEYPLSDLEIERLFRNWNKSRKNTESMTSAGFVRGVKLNVETEIR